MLGVLGMMRSGLGASLDDEIRQRVRATLASAVVGGLTFPELATTATATRFNFESGASGPDAVVTNTLRALRVAKALYVKAAVASTRQRPESTLGALDIPA